MSDQSVEPEPPQEPVWRDGKSKYEPKDTPPEPPSPPKPDRGSRVSTFYLVWAILATALSGSLFVYYHGKVDRLEGKLYACSASFNELYGMTAKLVEAYQWVESRCRTWKPSEELTDDRD